MDVNGAMSSSTTFIFMLSNSDWGLRLCNTDVWAPFSSLYNILIRTFEIQMISWICEGCRNASAKSMLTFDSNIYFSIRIFAIIIDLLGHFWFLVRRLYPRVRKTKKLKIKIGSDYRILLIVSLNQGWVDGFDQREICFYAI